MYRLQRRWHVDILIGNHALAPTAYENNGRVSPEVEDRRSKVRLDGLDPNAEGIGVRISVTIEGGTQVRGMRNGDACLSQEPEEVHFGLGEHETIETLTVTWPTMDRAESHAFGLATNQTVTIAHPQPVLPSLFVMHGEGSGVHVPGQVVETSALEQRENYLFSYWCVGAAVEFTDRHFSTTTVEMPSDALSIDMRLLPGVPVETVRLGTVCGGCAIVGCGQDIQKDGIGYYCLLMRVSFRRLF